MEDKNGLAQSKLSQKIGTNLTLLHLSQFLNNVVPFAGTIVPLVVYLNDSNESPLYKKHAAEILNFQITFFVVLIAMIITAGLSVGFGKLAEMDFVMVGSVAATTIAMVGFAFFGFIMTIVNAVKANRCEDSNYVLVVRILK